MRKQVTIIGYSLDTVLEAVRRSTIPDTDVTVVLTARLGDPLDGYGDCVSGGYADVLSELFNGNLEFDEYVNPRYIYLPYGNVKIANHKNGVIQFPLSQKSFDDESEWMACVNTFADRSVRECMSDLSLPPTKLIAALKNVMPPCFTDTFIRPMGVTRWRGVQVSKLSMQGYRYEFPLDFIDRADYTETFCRPRMSYEKICQRIFSRLGIKYHTATLDDASAIVKHNKYPGHVVIMDNRVDQMVDYIGGRFDRQKFTPVRMKVPPELEFAGDGLFYTPLSSCWAISVFNGEATRFMTEPVETLYGTDLTEIPSTRTNIKLYDAYVNLIRQFGDKELMLGQRVDTLIK